MHLSAILHLLLVFSWSGTEGKSDLGKAKAVQLSAGMSLCARISLGVVLVIGGREIVNVIQSQSDRSSVQMHTHHTFFVRSHHLSGDPRNNLFVLPSIGKKAAVPP